MCKTALMLLAVSYLVKSTTFEVIKEQLTGMTYTFTDDHAFVDNFGDI